jgi:Putative modulator of DNA gyrase.
MMIATIREAIASINAHDTTKISDWRLVERRLERQERYYVASKAEQARTVDETLYSLTVYVDTIASGASGSGGTSSGAGTGSLPNAASGSASSEGTNNPSASPALKKFRGEATITIQPTFSRAECEAKIRQAAFAASKSRNPWFELPEPSAPKTSVPVSGFEALSPAERIETVRHAFFSAANRFGGNARINSLELFITKETKRLLNSRGFDFASPYGEVTANSLSKRTAPRALSSSLMILNSQSPMPPGFRKRLKPALLRCAIGHMPHQCLLSRAFPSSCAGKRPRKFLAGFSTTRARK